VLRPEDSTVLKACRGGDEELLPFLFVAPILEPVSYLALGLTNTIMLTTVDRME
jgi:hypothetical protein